MDSAATLVLFALLISFVPDATASCRKVANEEMLEYTCEGGHPADLTTIPETTEKLRIIRMPLRRITADTFARFSRNLWVLSCSDCEITDIDADAFRRLVNLQQLSLDSNRLTTVKASWFEGLDYLTYLDLNYNDIRDIEDGVYKNLPNLVDLRISGNRLRCLNLDEMSHLGELKRIFLGENSEFACPHAVSKFLENQGVTFEQDPEWRKLASDTVDVHVPPSHVEEDRETVPAHRERLHPDRKPRPEESEGPYLSRDKSFYPSHSEHGRPRHRRPPTTTVRPRQQESPIPQMEPIFPKPSEELTPPALPSEDIKMSEADESSRTEHTLTYSPHPTHETTPPHSTPERSRTPPTISEDIRGTDRPPYIPTHETIPYSSYPTSDRPRVVGSSEYETMRQSERPSHGYTITYPLTTFDDLERVPHESVRGTHLSSDVSEMILWGTDDSVEHSVDSSWTQERHEQSRRPAGENDRASTETPYYGHDPRKMIVEESPLKIDNDVLVATDRPAEHDRSQIMTASSEHYVRPLSSYSPSTNTHPPQNYQKLTTESPYTECPGSASTTRSTAVLVTCVVIAVLGHVVERF